MISNLDKIDSKFLVLCKEWSACGLPWSLWVPPTRAHVLWSKSSVSFCCSLFSSPSAVPLPPHPTIPESHLSKGLKSSLSENSSLCFILIASPATNHISSCFNLGGGVKNGLSPVTSFCMWEPLSLWLYEVFSVFSSGTVNSSPLLVVGVGGFLFFSGRRKILRGGRRKAGERRELQL